MVYKKNLLPCFVANKKASVFSEILSLLYTYSYDDKPEYNRIIFMYEKILLDMNITPSLTNLDWKMIDF